MISILQVDRELTPLLVAMSLQGHTVDCMYDDFERCYHYHVVARQHCGSHKIAVAVEFKGNVISLSCMSIAAECGLATVCETFHQVVKRIIPWI